MRSCWLSSLMDLLFQALSVGYFYSRISIKPLCLLVGVPWHEIAILGKLQEGLCLLCSCESLDPSLALFFTLEELNDAPAIKELPCWRCVATCK
ncbi:hypothetical protein SLEP1_g27890 [Rubroshorea leprosula]|uniref:Secreted protein n=1 Tax=Rubroshorea leprosula TaxID=152421 RepID=A0AAV5JYY3_9ROSI|nr:hypothetical protein SLEP1_g27890 [Rubroshorea leprosula]